MSLSAILTELENARNELQHQLPRHWSNVGIDGQSVLLALAASHTLKPYGRGTTIDLPSLLSATTLDCSNYGVLLCHILGGVPTTQRDSTQLTFVGWDGGAIGNHQTLFATSLGESHLFLDPTTGVAARASFESLAMGNRVPRRDIIVFNPSSELQGSRNQVITALRAGLFRPTDLLYYFGDVEHLSTRFGSIDSWPTPAAVRLTKNLRHA